MLSTFTTLSLPTFYCESGCPLEADSTVKANRVVKPIHRAAAGEPCPQMPHVSPLSGNYRPGTAAGFARHTAQASAGLRLKGLYGDEIDFDQHQVVGRTFGCSPLSPGALRILTNALQSHGPPDRETLSSRSGVRNATFLNMKKAGQALQSNMRRSLLATSFGPGTGFRTLENTMPLRDMLREGNKLQQFRETGTIEGISTVVIPTPGLPPKPRHIGGTAGADHVSLDVAEGRGAYRFSEGTWRPVTAPEARTATRAMHDRILQQRGAARPDVLPRVAGKHATRCTHKSADEQQAATPAGQAHSAAPEAEKQPRSRSRDSGSDPDGPAGQTVQMIDVESGQGAAAAEDRRPMTAAGSSVYATAMRQLESEQRQLEGRTGRARTSSTAASFSHFKPTRGNMLMVFSHLDEDQNGIVTESEFVGSMVELGCTTEEAHGYFCRLDKRGQGFLRLRDWGAHDRALASIVETLTTRYMRKHLRLPSAVTSAEAAEAYMAARKAKEVGTMKQMQELAAAYAFQRSSQSKNTGIGPVEAALRFVDADDTGRLGKPELMDAFGAMGVIVKPQLMDILLHQLEKDESGKVEYKVLLSMFGSKAKHN
eukprot:jgi/Ulvmu1/7135/UM034_0041.1